MSATALSPDSEHEERRALLIYDGTIATSNRWVERLKTIAGDRIDFAVGQDVPQALRLIEPGGDVAHGVGAVLRVMALVGQRRPLAWAYAHLPGPAGVIDAIFRRAIGNPSETRIERWLFGITELRDSYVLSRAIFLRALGLVYLAAFVSLWVQIDGLIGSRGILPANLHLAAIRAEHSELSVVWRFLADPTLCWISASDGFLHFLCAGGAAFAIAVVLGFAPAPALALLWLFYLSLVRVGQEFLGYQWDALLLEAGLISIFLAPLQLRLRPSPALTWQIFRSRAARDHDPIPLARPSGIVLLLLRWLLFRLMFLSGLVKLTSGDATWRGFTAMRYHYWTQPLPTWTSWYAHLAPNWFQAISTGGVFFVEVLIPLLMFAPRRLRLFACAAIVLFQLLIAGTGNYGFFNLLAIVMCIPLIDDAAWKRLGLISGRVVASTSRGRWPAAITAPVAAAIFALSFAPGLYWLGLGDLVPRPLLRGYVAVMQFESINGYGLFANMTTERPELVIEGSDDGISWRAYEFRWKPGDVRRRPRFCAPHMPRLDWQMWFAALDLVRGREDPWVWRFLERLSEGSPPVLNLLRDNPFPHRPPRDLRVVVYYYRFTTGAERARSGAWWERTQLGVWTTVERRQQN